jgi:hypothetical protein
MSAQMEAVPSANCDLGHQGDFDYTQIARALARTPTERLDHHEGWRLFVKEALRNAALGVRQAYGGKSLNISSACRINKRRE